MDGIINVLKPPGMTSHDVVSFIRKKLDISRVGHTGTLDPGVPGVLPICIGKATRVAEFLTQGTKAYRGIIKFGIKTTTQDSFGEITESGNGSMLKEIDIERCLYRFTGAIKQVPPMVSAVKLNGKKLYELAREGKEVIREPRDVTIFSLNIIKHINIGDKHPETMFDVVCSKGTYIRTLCHDIGEAVGTGAHMSFLLRTASGPYKLKDTYTLEEISALVENRQITNAILPIDSAIDYMPEIRVRESAVKSVCNGSTLYPQGVEFQGVNLLDKEPAGEKHDRTLVRLKNPDGVLLAVAEVRFDEMEQGKRQVYRPVKVFAEGE